MYGIVSVCTSDGDVFLKTDKSGGVISFQGGFRAAIKAEQVGLKRAMGSEKGAATAASYILQFDPRAQEINDLSELIKAGICSEKVIHMKISGEKVIFTGVKCDGPNAWDWHQCGMEIRLPE